MSKIGRIQALWFGILLAISAALGILALADETPPIQPGDRLQVGIMGFMFMVIAIGVLISDFSADESDEEADTQAPKGAPK